MEWRPFRDFEESRVREELAAVCSDVEVGRELASQYLRTLKPIAGCFAFVITTRSEQKKVLTEYVEQLRDAHDAITVLLSVGSTHWDYLPGTRAWMNIVRVRLRNTIRKALSLNPPTALSWRLLDAEAYNLWMSVCEAEQRVIPTNKWEMAC